MTIIDLKWVTEELEKNVEEYNTLNQQIAQLQQKQQQVLGVANSLNSMKEKLEGEDSDKKKKGK